MSNLSDSSHCGAGGSWRGWQAVWELGGRIQVFGGVPRHQSLCFSHGRTRLSIYIFIYLSIYLCIHLAIKLAS